MDANNEYLLEGFTYDKDFVCLSSYIYYEGKITTFFHNPVKKACSNLSISEKTSIFALAKRSMGD